MNLLIVAIGSYGDVLPLFGLALALEKRGHTITFFSNEHFSPLSKRFGLNFVPLGSSAEYEAFTKNPDLWNKYKGWKLICSTLVSEPLRQAYTTLLPYVLKERSILVCSSLGFAARLLQETHQVPTATVHLSPSLFQSAYAPPKMPGMLMPNWLPVTAKRMVWSILNSSFIDPIIAPALNQYRQELGLAPVSNIFSEWLHSPDLTLCLFPPWFGRPQPDWPTQVRLTTFPLFDDVFRAPLPEKIQQFLAEGTPPLVFTPGTANQFAHHFFEEGIKTCQKVNKRGLLLTQFPQQLPSSLPPGVQHFPYAPLSQLLPHCAGLIHHGGIGTCAQALRAGIPQIIQPLNFDQFDNADRISRLSVGHTISAGTFNVQTLSKSLDALLTSPEVKTQCAGIAGNFSEANPLEEDCHIIESMFYQNGKNHSY